LLQNDKTDLCKLNKINNLSTNLDFNTSRVRVKNSNMLKNRKCVIVVKGCVFLLVMNFFKPKLVTS